MRWRDAMRTALYGPDGFFVREPARRPLPDQRAASPSSPAARSRLLAAASTGRSAIPSRVRPGGRGRGAGRAAARRAGRAAARRRWPGCGRLRRRGRRRAPSDLPGPIAWRDELPRRPSPGCCWPPSGSTTCRWTSPPRRVVPPVDPTTGEETVRRRRSAAEDADWLRAWWPAEPGEHVEIGRRPGRGLGRTRSAASTRGWRSPSTTGTVRGAAGDGTLTGFRAGRQVPPVPDGRRHHRHVAVDSVAAAGSGSPGARTPWSAAGGAAGARGRRRATAADPGLDRPGRVRAGARRRVGGGRADRPGRPRRALVAAREPVGVGHSPCRLVAAMTGHDHPTTRADLAGETDRAATGTPARARAQHSAPTWCSTSARSTRPRTACSG